MHQPRLHRARSAGFGLVEIMVGLLISMIAVIIMMQVFSVSEGMKRTTTGGDDAQTNGAIALYSLQRDLRQSGLGVSALPIVGCNLLLRAGVTLNAMSPVTINHPSIPAGVGDTLTIVYGSGNGSPEGEKIEAQPVQTTYAVAAAASSATAPGAFSAGDRLIVQKDPRPSPCNVTLESVTGLAGANVTVATGVAGATGGIAYNVGQAPVVLVYAVRGGNLTVCDYMVNDCSLAANVGNAAIWEPIATGIVSLRAQYGQDTNTPMDGVLDAYTQATPATACGWAKVSGIRLALASRSGLYEREDQATLQDVTTQAPTWAGSASSPTSATASPIDLSGYTDWQNYRYKIFETTVPMRNIVWQGVQSGC